MTTPDLLALDALKEAATSLETVSRLAGRGEYMESMEQVRGYAHSRATVAIAALEAAKVGEPIYSKEWLKDKLERYGDLFDLPTSCLCCGHVGKPAAWAIDYPKFYVCTGCKEKVDRAAQPVGVPQGWVMEQDIIRNQNVAETLARAGETIVPIAAVPVPVEPQWEMPDEKRMFGFINANPILQSLLYDINLLPEQIEDATRWSYLVAVCSHYEMAILNAVPVEPVVPQRIDETDKDTLIALMNDTRLTSHESTAIYRAMYAMAPAPLVVEPVAIDFTDTARAGLLWVLYNHQGGSSPVGQPIRFALGLGKYDDLSPEQIDEAKRWNALHPTRVVESVEPQGDPMPDKSINERVAQLTAHRACHNQEQDIQNGKLAGYCIVCGVPWPCDVARPAPAGLPAWIPVRERLPECDMTPNTFGVQVLVYPPFKSNGASDMSVAFYGCRQTDKPNFYMFGRVFDPTHWMPLPEPPQAAIAAQGAKS